ncbi:MAG: hypothetical protein WC462_03910 [archaeon]
MKYVKERQIAKGWSSYIWLVKDSNRKEFILKEVREKSPRKDLAEREGKMLLLANKVGIGPKVREINFEENFVIMDYIKGKKLVDWILGKEFEEVNAEQLYFFIKELYKQLLALDSINLSHNQLQVGKNILVEKRRSEKGKENYFPVIIDFEKATIKENNHTRNIGQIESMFFYNPNGAIAKKTKEKLNLVL